MAVDKNNSRTLISKGFRCAFCDKHRVGAYRWVDGGRSCENCNRSYDPPPREVVKIYSIDCPLCKGKGKLCSEKEST